MLRFFTFRWAIPERYWKNKPVGEDLKMYKGKYEIMIEMFGIGMALGSDYKVLPFKNIRLPHEKLMILEKAVQADDFVWLTIDVRENPVFISTLIAGGLGVLGIGLLGWSITKITRLVQVTSKSIILLAAIAGAVYIIFKKVVK